MIAATAPTSSSESSIHRCALLLQTCVPPDTGAGVRARLPPFCLATSIRGRSRRSGAPDAPARSVTRSPARPGPTGPASRPGRRGAARRRARRRRAAARPRRARPGRRGRAARGAASARRSSSCSMVAADERMDPPEQPAEHDEPRVEDVDEAGERRCRASGRLVERAQGDRRAGLGVAPAPRRRSARPPPGGRPATPQQRRSPTSVSQQPIEPQRHGGPVGLTGMWPTSPP